MTAAAQFEYHEDVGKLICKGNWTINAVDYLESRLSQWIPISKKSVTIDGAAMDKIDSAGAMMLYQLIERLRRQGIEVSESQLIPQCQSLLTMIRGEEAKDHEPVLQPSVPSILYIIGQWGVGKWMEVYSFVMFIGHFVIVCCEAFRRPARLPWRSVLVTIDEGGYCALPIVALLTFLVGIVITYQMAIELQSYGANIYAVDLSGMIIFREFGPLITAIIAAGRTSTAFTAQIGTMKVNEELDALKTMGVNPMLRLVVPKFIGLLIALPLLTVWADIFGVMGAMLMAKAKLGISYTGYIDRFQTAISVRQYIVGLVKVPVFATIIALVGCYQGFEVGGSADSVGWQTTKSAVQALFLVIIADAVFSVIFSLRGY